MANTPDEATKAFLAKEHVEEESSYTNSPLSRRAKWYLAAATLINVLLAFLTMNYWISNRVDHAPSYWSTDLQDARHIVEYEQRTYTGVLDYDYES